MAVTRQLASTVHRAIIQVVGAGQLMLEGMPRRLDGLRSRLSKREPRPAAPSPMVAVREFHEALRLPIRETPSSGIPQDERELRVRLIREEADELAIAVAADDLLEIADALADLIYVTYGTALHYGIDLDAAMAEVHRANMSKVAPRKGAFLRGDGKVLKGDSYKAPDLAAVLGLDTGSSNPGGNPKT
jgi:predicted HAD superfamily Cof-like phosphohydrolase